MNSKTLFTTAILLFFISCKNAGEIQNTEKTPEKNTVAEEISHQKAIIAADWGPYQRSSPLEITHAEIINKNVLTISVRYNGGCKKHEFELIGANMVSKSLPPQRNIKLYHKNNDDNCRELVEEVLSFDITSLIYTEKSTIFNLENYDTPINYIP